MTVPTSSRSNSAVSKCPPVIIDLGKTSGKKIKKLKKGEGLYQEEVEPAIAQVKARLGDQLEGKEIFPVVIIYEKKAKRKKTIFDII